MAEPLKDRIDAALVKRYVDAIARVDPAADLEPLAAAASALAPLELKDRINVIADALAGSLSGSLTRQIDSTVALSRCGIPDMGGWPIASFIERHALAEPDAALTAMRTITESFTCEFAIRPFLTEHFELAMSHVLRWTSDESEHPRRLASEGTRPRLPWGPNVPQLSADPSHGLAVLERLRHDQSEYVRRSVANHLNDIAKTDPDLVIATTRRWATESATDMAMIRHALRSLIKAGSAGAMQVLGFVTEPKIAEVGFTVAPVDVTLGGSIELRLSLSSASSDAQKLVVDFVVHHVLANGETSPKVFKWATPTLEAGQTVELVKRRKIATASTRRYYAGEHRVEALVAGRVVGSGQFLLAQGS